MTEAPVPELKDGEVMFRMLSVGICGSDVGNYHRGTARYRLPGQCGHEFVGEVIDTTVASISLRQRFLVVPPQANGFAEFLAVGPQHCVPVPDALDAEVAVLAQQFGTVLHALRRVGSLLDRVVTVIGAGPAGLSFLTMALNMGARLVHVFETREARRDAALRAGADAVHLPAQADDLIDQLGGGSEVVIDAAGGQGAIDLAYKLVRKQGTVLRFGLPKDATTLDHEVAIRKEVQALHAVGAQQEPNLACFRLALRLLERGTVDLKRTTSHTLSLANIPEALALASDPDRDALKVVISAALVNPPPVGLKTGKD
jgi:2-desacetyl-2-hydroxyethyl bacteriochlorophyllide A dehydrogenase